MKQLDRGTTAENLVERIWEDGDAVATLFPDALRHGRTGFCEMSDEALLEACAVWDIEPAYLPEESGALARAFGLETEADLERSAP